MAQKQQLSKIFFDLDGTLLDVSDRNYTVYRELVEEFSGRPLSKANYWHLKREKAKWSLLLPKSSLSADIEKEFLGRFIPRIEAREYLKMDELYPEALDIVRNLSTHIPCYLVSLRRNEDNLIEELGWLGLGEYFTKVLSGHSETDGYDKKIELITSELAGPALIIGDTEADIVTGKKLGLVTVGLTSGIRSRKFLEALEPDYLFDSVKKISDLPFFRR